jgi:hypothetical protein
MRPMMSQNQHPLWKRFYPARDKAKYPRAEDEPLEVNLKRLCMRVMEPWEDIISWATNQDAPIPGPSLLRLANFREVALSWLTTYDPRMLDSLIADSSIDGWLKDKLDQGVKHWHDLERQHIDHLRASSIIKDYLFPGLADAEPLNQMALGSTEGASQIGQRQTTIQMETDHLSELIEEGAAQKVWDILGNAEPIERIKFLLENELDLEALDEETQSRILTTADPKELLVLALEALAKFGANSNGIFRTAIWDRAGFEDFTRALGEIDASAWEYFERGPWEPGGWPLALYPAVIQECEFDCAVDVLEDVDIGGNFAEMFLTGSDLAGMKVRTLTRLYRATRNWSDIPDVLFALITKRLPDAEAIGFFWDLADDGNDSNQHAALSILQTRVKWEPKGASVTVPAPTENAQPKYVYGCNVPEFQLSDGRRVHLISMRVQPTYAGTLFGRPSRSSNDCLLASIVQEASQHFNLAGEAEAQGRMAWLVQPDRTIASSAPSEQREREDLPGVLWMASLKSGPIPSNPWNEFSRLDVIWLQQDFQFGPRSEEILQDLPWEAHAWSYGVDEF